MHSDLKCCTLENQYVKFSVIRKEYLQSVGSFKTDVARYTQLDASNIRLPSESCEPPFLQSHSPSKPQGRKNGGKDPIKHYKYRTIASWCILMGSIIKSSSP